MQWRCCSHGQWFEKLNNCLSYPKFTDSLSKTPLMLMGAETSVQVMAHLDAGSIKRMGRHE